MLIEAPQSTGVVHLSQNSGENEWYTPPEIIAAARTIMGRIDTDPASSEKANQEYTDLRSGSQDALTPFGLRRVIYEHAYFLDIPGVELLRNGI